MLINTPMADLPLPHEIELVCYRIVREAVANVIKHAMSANGRGVTELSIRLARAQHRR